jgi:hypothetical protein
VTRWSEQQLAEFQSRVATARRLPVIDTSVRPFALPNNTAGAFALGRLPTGTMNKSEKAYAERLAYLATLRQVLWWKFEGLKLRLGDNTFYTPDFVVMPADCRIECHEVKGFWRDDARAKIKIAASIYPFRFIAVTKKRDGWEREEFS